MAKAKKAAPKFKKIRILLPVAAKFKLPYDVGKEYEIETKQADVLIDAKYAKEIK